MLGDFTFDSECAMIDENLKAGRNHRTPPYSPSSVTSLPSSSLGSFDAQTQPPRNFSFISAYTRSVSEDVECSNDAGMNSEALASTDPAGSILTSAIAFPSSDAKSSAHTTSGDNETDEELEIEDSDDDDDKYERDIHDASYIDRELCTSLPEEEGGGEDSASSIATDSWPSSGHSKLASI